MSAQFPADKINWYLWVLFLICFFSNLLGGTVSTLMAVYLPMVVKTFQGDVDKELLYDVSAYINALYIFGWAIGGLSWGVISDKIGRSKSLTFAVGSFGLLTLCTSFVNSWELVVIFRFLAGFGVGGVMVISTTLLSEVWPESTKSIFIGILSIGFPVGIFAAGLVNLLFSGWREGFMIGIFPLLLAIGVLFCVNESEKWKISSKVTSKKTFALQQHKHEIIYGSMIFGSMIIGVWAMFSWLPTWVHSLLQGGDGQSERGLSMMLMGAGGVAGGFFSGWISKSFGVRKSLLICFSGCIAMSLLLFKGNSSFSEIIYLEIAMLAIFFGISQGLLATYIPQLFPTNIRATATGVCFNLGRFITAFAVFSLGTLVTVVGGYGNALLLFSTVFVLGFIAIYFTKNRPNSTELNPEVVLSNTSGTTKYKVKSKIY